MNFRIGSMIAVATLFAGGIAMAEGEGTQRGPMHGGRGQMMAAMQECIKSGKPMPDCRQEMMKNHKGGMDKGSCPMKAHGAEHGSSGEEG